MEAFLRDITQIVHNPYVALIFFSALAFDFINGFHDAANSIATIVGTRGTAAIPKRFAGRRGGTSPRLGSSASTSPTPSPNGSSRSMSPSTSSSPACWARSSGTDHVVRRLAVQFLARATRRLWRRRRHSRRQDGRRHAHGESRGDGRIHRHRALIGMFLACSARPSSCGRFAKLRHQGGKYFRIAQLGSAAAYSLGHGTTMPKNHGHCRRAALRHDLEQRPSRVRHRKSGVPLLDRVICHAAIRPARCAAAGAS